MAEDVNESHTHHINPGIVNLLTIAAVVVVTIAIMRWGATKKWTGGLSGLTS